MNNCKHSRYEYSQGIEHAFCTNEALKEINKSNGKDIPCMRSDCGQFEPTDSDNQAETEK